eukprot:366126-Chlamydomonas_euryale.AAC.7
MPGLCATTPPLYNNSTVCAKTSPVQQPTLYGSALQWCLKNSSRGFQKPVQLPWHDSRNVRMALAAMRTSHVHL